MLVRRKLIRSKVEKLLAQCGVRDAPVPVENIAEALAIVVQREPTDDDLSGFLYKARRGNKAVIGVNANHHPNRQNFTIAHELGHFLLHDVDDVHVDRGFNVRLRSETSSQGTDVEEKEANLFAAELLMPARLLEDDLDEISAFDLDDEEATRKLARRYGVSTQAMMFRLANLGYIRL